MPSKLCYQVCEENTKFNVHNRLGTTPDMIIYISIFPLDHLKYIALMSIALLNKKMQLRIYTKRWFI